MTSIYDKQKADDFSKELNVLLIKYGLKISLGLRYTLQGIFPIMELVPMEEEGDKLKGKEDKEEKTEKKGEILGAN